MEEIPTIRLATTSPDQTKALAGALAGLLVDGDLLVLTGDLGAGKTCFTQGLGAGLGVTDRITSPTFTLANRYEGRLVLNHLDAYRIDSLDETTDLGLGELFEDGVTVIEWGDRIDEVLPTDHLLVALRYPDLDPHIEDPAEDPASDPQLEDTAGVDRRSIDISVPAGCGHSTWGGRGLCDALRPWSRS